MCISIEDPQTDSDIHDHLFHEIAYIRSGHANHLTATGAEPINKGTIIMIRPQVWHAYQQCRKLTVVNCLFNSQLLYQLLPLLADTPQIADMLRAERKQPARETPIVFHLPEHAQKYCLRLMNHMSEEQKSSERGWLSSCIADLLQLLVLIARHAGCSSPAVLSPATESAMLKAAQYIESHFSQNFSLATLASSCGVSRSHLSRHFPLRLGMGVVDYQHRLRVEEACRLLRLTGMSITQIAQRTGYSEVAYFSRCFKRMMGISPRHYRLGQYAE